MYKGISIALLVVGILLIFWGISASESFNSEVSRFFTGKPTDKTMWLLVSGTILGIVGLFGVFHSLKQVA